MDEARRARAESAVRKGIDCILKCQIAVNGKRAAWCQQHDEKTFAPAPARAYERPSLASMESLGIVRFLMGIDRPGPEVIQAIQAAVTWFDAAKLTGIRYEEKRGESAEGGHDRVVVADPAAPPLWARFYEIGTNRPIFSVPGLAEAMGAGRQRSRAKNRERELNSPSWHFLWTSRKRKEEIGRMRKKANHWPPRVVVALAVTAGVAGAAYNASGNRVSVSKGGEAPVGWASVEGGTRAAWAGRRSPPPTPNRSSNMSRVRMP